MKKNLFAILLTAVLITIAVGNFWVKKPTSNEPESNKETNDESAYIATDEPEGNNEADDESVYIAPDFELQTLQGETVRLSDYIGKKVLVNFWATWCTSCKAELPHMQRFYEHHQDKGVEILAVNVTSQDNGKAAVEDIATQYGLTYKLLLDEDGFAAMDYQILSLPTSFFINEEGHIVEAIAGPMDEAFMTELMEQI